MRNQQGICALYVVNRLAQQASRMHVPKTKRVNGANQYQIKIPTHPPMLKTVIHQENIDMKLRFEKHPNGPAVLAYAYVSIPGPHQDLSFIPG